MTEKKPAKKARPDVRALIKKAAQDTRDVFETTIMAPVVPGCRVRVRIAGVVSEFDVDDREFLGWALLKPEAPGQATLIGEASPAQVKAYMELLPRFQMIMLKELQSSWWALPAQGSDSRISISHPVPIRLAARIMSFDTATVRFDGASFWFESIARRRNPAVARTLRDQLSKEVFPEDLQCAEMTPQERLAYAFLFYEQFPELIEQDAPVSIPTDHTSESTAAIENTFDYDTWLKDFQKVRGILEREHEMGKIKHALRHAGAQLHSYWRSRPMDREVNVNIIVDGKNHIARVDCRDLTVVNAGVCLSGRDMDFDLTSLVGVLREAPGSQPWIWDQ